MIDTLKFATRLRSAGFSQEQAEAVAGAWAEQAADSLPSRFDFVRLESAFADLEDRMESRFAALDSELKSSTGMLEAQIGGKSTAFDSKIDGGITRLEGKLDRLTWMVGFALAGILAIIIRLLLLGP